MYIQIPWIIINKRLNNKQNHKCTAQILKTKINASTQPANVNIFRKTVNTYYNFKIKTLELLVGKIPLKIINMIRVGF